MFLENFISLARFDLLLFNQELASLLESGLSLIEALETLVSKESNPYSKGIIETILLKLKEGKTFSTSLASQHSIFPELYIASIKATERTGGLPIAIKKYVQYQTQVEILKRKIISASIYPMVLLIIGSIVIFFLLGYVVPKFSHIFMDSGRSLPFASQVLINMGVALEQHGLIIFSTIGSLIVLFIYFINLPIVKKWLAEMVWKLPYLGDFLKTYQLTKFYRSLSMLLGAGIPILQALKQSSQLLGANLQGAANKAMQDIQDGLPLSLAAKNHNLTTSVALSLIRVGEKTGEMAKMLENTAIFHDEEINRWLEWITKLLEPILMTFIGLVVGLIVVLMYLPIFELAGSL